MPNFYEDNPDLKFYVEQYLDWAPLVAMTEFNHKAPDGFATTAEALEFYKSVLDLIGAFSADAVAPNAAQIDREHSTLVDSEVTFPPVLQEIFDQLKEMQVHGMCLPRDFDGMNCPYILFLIVTELMARGDVSVAAHAGFHGGMALAALMFSVIEGTTEFDLENARITKTRFAKTIAEIAAGEAWGSMDITEPGAGTDMAALGTRGVLDENGQWRITGNKIFITSGHAKYHYVIARTEEPKPGASSLDGLANLSMFLVTAYEDTPSGERVRYAWFDKLEEKLGHHGSATVAVRYENTPALLIGNRGDGFRMMLLLMNNARLGVGFESLGLCEAALRLAKEYAAGRPSMGKMIDQHEMIADYLEEMENDILALRAICMEGAYHEEMSQKIRLTLQFTPPANPQEREELERAHNSHQAKSRRLTPLVKYFGSEKAVEIARRCIQIHGGYGYINEYGAEKLLRDALVLPIYEGTSQIQALMAMKDALGGILKAPARFLKGGFNALVQSFTADADTRRVARLQRRQYAVLRFLLTRLALKKLAGGLANFSKPWDPKRDFALAMLHAERLIKILTDVAIAEVLLAQSKRFPERQIILHRHLERAEPRCRFYQHEITTTGQALLARLEKNHGAH